MHLPHLSAFEKAPIVFLTTCTHRRQALLANALAHSVLLDIWTRSAELNGWFVGEYVLMPDHAHLFAAPGPRACSLAAWMQLWKAIAARNINRALSRQGTVWQADYFDRYLRSRHDYEQKWAYVEQNPVRQELVTDHKEWWAYRGIIHDLRCRKARD
jgi:REP element-mobilizing transposase RayT